MRQVFLLALITILFGSCFGDKKSAISTTLSDDSFVNKNFKGNRLEYADISSPCQYISKEALAKYYGTSNDKVLLMGGNSSSKTCTIRIQLSDQEFDYLTGSIHFYEEANKRPDGSTWEDDWQLQKEISKRSEWISNVGKAAMYKEPKRELLIKYDGYTMSVIAPGSAVNQIEKSKNRDYKKIAISMAQNTPLF
jgi:hypothetical protein